MWAAAILLAGQLPAFTSTNRGDSQSYVSIFSDYSNLNPQESSISDHYQTTGSENYDSIFGVKDLEYHDYYTDTVFNSTQKCGPEDFHCPKYDGNYGYCIEKADISIKVCDGVYDCLNGADETLCEHWKAGVKDTMLLKKEIGFKCNNGLYVPNLWKCDGYCDCNGDCEDESMDSTGSNCGSSSNIMQTSSKLCREDPLLRCDGWLDCIDGSDENSCPAIFKSAGTNHYKYKNSKGEMPSTLYKGKMPVWIKCADSDRSQQWYHHTFACDGKKDCSDGTDEKECFDATKPHLNNLISKANLCQDGKGLMCKTSPGQPFTCINRLTACNEHLITDAFKCFDTNRNRLYLDSDNDISKRMVSPREHSTCSSKSIYCKYDEFKCRIKAEIDSDQDPYVCIANTKLCDINHDCYVPEEPSTTVTGHLQQMADLFTMFLGNGESNDTAWAHAKALQGYKNDEDSELCAINAKKDTNCTGIYACPKERNCIQTKVVKTTKLENTNTTTCGDCRCAKCGEGMRPSRKGCMDIDECQRNWYGKYHHPCSHGCTNLDATEPENTIGYFCHCPAGLALGLDGHTCRPLSVKDFPVSLYVTQSDVITQLSIQMNHTSVDENPNWEIVNEKTIFQKANATFTAIAIDDNNGIVNTRSHGKSAIIYFAQYSGDKKADNKGGVIYKYTESEPGNAVRSKAEEFYTFKSGRVEKMSFDHISGLLHVTVSRFEHTPPCNSTLTTEIGVHVMFPTYSKTKYNIPFFAHHVTLFRPRGIVSVPDHGATYIVDWMPTKSVTSSTIHKITFSNLAAGEFRAVSKKLPMKYPNNVINDAFHHRLLIVDESSKIISCDYELKKCRSFGSHSAGHPYGIDMLGKYIVVAEMKQPELSIMNIYNPADITILRRFGKQTYNVAVRNHEYKAKSGLTQNIEICKESKKCDYMCITYNLKTFASIVKQDYNSTNAGIIGATCMCPDGSMNNTIGATCAPGGDGSYAVKHIGLVMSTVDDKANFQVFDVAHGNRMHRNLQVNPNYAKNFNGSRFYSGEFFNPVDRKMYKWQPGEGLLHILEFELFNCDEAQNFDKIAESEILYQSEGALRNNDTSSYSYSSSYTNDWIVGLKGSAKMNFRRPVVIAELNLVCGYTYVRDAQNMPKDHDYVLYCFKLNDIAKSTKSAIALLTSNAPSRFDADAFSLVILDYIENKIDFYDWYNIHTGESYHSVNVTHVEEEYGSLDNVHHVNGLNGEVFLTTNKYLLNYVVDDKKQDSTGETNMVLNMTRLLEANPTLLNQCNISSSYSWEFKNIKVINNTETNSAYLYGSWYSSCQTSIGPQASQPSSYSSSLSFQTYKSTNTYYSNYVTISKSVIFSCKIDSRRKELDPNACKVMDSAGKVINPDPFNLDSSHVTDWTTFVDLTSPKITPLDCSEQPALKTEGITCEYFCALEPYKGRKAHCVCPLGHLWDEVNQKCTKTEKCDRTCTTDGGKQLCLVNEMLCDGYKDCEDGSDESLASGCRTDLCDIDEFACGNVSGNATKQCVPFSKRCDGTKDCNGNHIGFDEENCDQSFSFCNSTSQFFCSNHSGLYYDYNYGVFSRGFSDDKKGFCLPWAVVGDGVSNCFDGRDETSGSKKEKCLRNDGKMCYSNDICLTDKRTWCDGVDDCGLTPSSYTTGTYLTDKSEEYTSFCTIANVTCNKDTHFRCPSSRQCIDKRLLCDGHNHCNEGAEDESMALCKGKSKKLENLQFFKHVTDNRTKAWDSAVGCKSSIYCIAKLTKDAANKLSYGEGLINPNMKQQICVETEMLCDGRKDCENGIDEGGDCDACSELTEKEQEVCGICTNTPHGPQCSCDHEASKPENADFSVETMFGRVWKPEFEGLMLLERNGSEPSCRFRNFCNVIGTCDQRCVPLQKIDEHTKGPYLCRCKNGYRVAGATKHHCRRMFSEPVMYLLDENDVIKKYTIPRSKALSNLSFNETIFAGFDQLNHDSTHRKLIAQSRGEFNHVVKRFATVEPAMFEKTERAIYTVERASDGYDVIYAKPIVGRTNWDVMINLPRIIITDFTVGLSTAKFTYLYISAQLESGKIGIYALSLSGNAALIISGVPGWRQAPDQDSSKLSDNLPDFKEPPQNLIYNKDRGALYFTYRKALYRYKFADMNLDLVRGFDGEITSLTLDSGWDKFVVVVGSQDVWFVNFNGQKVHQLHLHPKMPKITSVLTWEDQLIVADSFFYFTIFNKFTGMEFSDSKAMRMKFMSNEGTISKIKQIFNVESSRKPYGGRFNWSVKFRGHVVHGEKTTVDQKTPATEMVPICPMNTFNIKDGERYSSKSTENTSENNENINTCFCLGWDQMKPILTPKINASDYFDTNYQKCGVPKCDLETISRYAVLRRAIPHYFRPTVESELTTPTTRTNGKNMSSTCYAGMQATYSKVDDSYWKKYEMGSYGGYGGGYYAGYSSFLSTQTSLETKTSLEAFDEIEYQCQRIGEYVPNKTVTYAETYNGYLVAKSSTKTNTYHLMVDGAFLAEPGWEADFKIHELDSKKNTESYQGYIYRPYKRETNTEKIKREQAIGYVNSKYFGDKFTGKMCDNDAHLSLAAMFFSDLDNCTLTCQGTCATVNNDMETAVNSKVTSTDTYKSIIDHIGKFYCKCEEGTTGRNCDMYKIAPVAFVGDRANGWLVAGILIMVLVLIGLVVVVGFLRGYKTENPYFENQFAKMHYTDLEEDRDADFPDNRGRKNDFDPFDTSNTQTVGNKNTNAANSEFDYNPTTNEKGSLPNLVDMDACMGFNIPTNNGTWNSHNSPPDYSADTSGIVPDDQSSVKEESKQSKTVIKNPFYGTNNKQRGSTNSTEALVDI